MTAQQDLGETRELVASCAASSACCNHTELLEEERLTDDFWRAVIEEEQGWKAEPTCQVRTNLEMAATRAKESGRGLGCLLDFIEENPIGVTIFPASLSPPPLAGDGDPSPSSGAGGGWVLLDHKAYIAGCTNATTAKNSTRAGHEIQATLHAARPPRVSHLCVHCPALTPAFFGTEPRVLAAGDGVVFFRAALCNSYYCEEPTLQDYFVYRAPLSRDVRGRRPSLTRIPQPDGDFARCRFGILRCNDDGGAGAGDGGGPRCIPRNEHYVVAGLRDSASRRTRSWKGDWNWTEYDLHRFDSREGKWTTEELELGPMAPSPGLDYFYHMTHKVVALGGGVIGWVDLCRGIVLCDVLADRTQRRLHYLPLPEPGKQLLFEEASAKEFRDIAVVRGGQLRCVEHQTQMRPRSWSNGTYISDDWTLTTWSWKATNLSSASAWEGRWERDCKIDASRISGSLHKLLGRAAPLPPLPQLHTGLPTLSLDDDDVVYVLAKVDHRDEEAFVVAVNIRDGALQAADHFGAERMVGISFAYTQYRT